MISKEKHTIQPFKINPTTHFVSPVFYYCRESYFKISICYSEKMDRRRFIKTTGLVSFAVFTSSGFLLNGFEQQIHVIGIGGAGRNTVEYAKNTLTQGINYTIISSNLSHKGDSIRRINYHPDKNARKFRFWDQMKVQIPGNIQPVFKKEGRIILVSGLSGPTGTLLAKEMFKKFLDNKKDVWFIASYPFYFEGPKNKRRAETGTSDIASHKRFISYNLEDLRAIWGNMLLSDAYRQADKYNTKLIQNLIA